MEEALPIYLMKIKEKFIILAREYSRLESEKLM